MDSQRLQDDVAISSRHFLIFKVHKTMIHWNLWVYIEVRSLSASSTTFT